MVPVINATGVVLHTNLGRAPLMPAAIEHIAEKCTYEGFMPYTDRVDYVAAMTANHVWAEAVELRVRYAEIDAQGLAFTIDPGDFGGCYSPRFIGSCVWAA